MRSANMCCFVGVIIGVALTGALLGIFVVKRATTQMTELRQIHVIFSNGERTPKKSEVDTFPFSVHENETYYPHGYNALTNDGKMTVFNIGERLRRQYDSFLSKTYRQGESIMQAADTDISKMGALLLSAGLWPVHTNEMWSDIRWQPVPYKNMIFNKDYMLFEDNCPRYVHEKERMTELFFESLLPSHKDVYLKLSSLTGYNISSPSQVLRLTNLLAIQKRMKMSSPEWLDRIKYVLRDIVKIEYKMMFHNTLLRRLSSGKLLDNILFNTKQLMDKVQNEEEFVKLYTYSASLSNIAGILSTLEDVIHYPHRYGETVIFELHYRPFLNDYGFKIISWDDNSASRAVLLPQCEELCPLVYFGDKLKHVLNVNYEEECNYT